MNGRRRPAGPFGCLILWGMRPADPAAVADLWRRGGADHRGTARADRRRGAVHPRHRRDGPHMLVAGTTGRGQERVPADAGRLARARQHAGGARLRAHRLQGRGRVRERLPGPAARHAASSPTSTSTSAAGRWWRCARRSRYRERLLAEGRVPGHRAATTPPGSRAGRCPGCVARRGRVPPCPTERMPDFLNELTDVTARGRLAGHPPGAGHSAPAGVRQRGHQDQHGAAGLPPRRGSAGLHRRHRDPRRRRYRPRSARPRLRAHPSAARSSSSRAATSAARRPARVPRSPPGAAAGDCLARSRRSAGSRGPTPGAGERLGRTSAGDDRPGRSGGGHAAPPGGAPPPHRAWLDPLPALIPLAQRCQERRRASPGGLPPASGTGWRTGPREQAQRVTSPSTWRPAPHLLIGGAPQSGRTTALRTIAAADRGRLLPRRRAPVRARLRRGGARRRCQRLPHCGAVVRRTEKERAGRLLDRLAAEIARRQDLLAAAGFASVTEQRAPGARPPSGCPTWCCSSTGGKASPTDLGQHRQRTAAPALLIRLLSEGAERRAAGDRHRRTRPR